MPVDYSGYDIATGQPRSSLPTGFSYDSSGGVVDAQGNPVKIGPDGKPQASTLPDGSVVMGYNADGFPVYSQEGKDLSHREVGYFETATGYETPGKAVSGTLSYISPDVVNNLVDGIGGGGGDGGAAASGQTKLAQEEMRVPKEQAAGIYGAALAEAARAGGYQGPGGITAGTIEAPERLNRADYMNTAPTTAEAVDATNRMRRAETVNVQPVQRATVDGVDVNVNAPKLGQAAQTGSVKVGRAQVDPLADAIRAEQVRAAQNIATGPSSVMPTMRAGQTESLQQALAVASQARGNERAGARREAILAAEQGGLAASLKAAALSAQEEQAKRVASSEALGTVRAADLSSAQARQQIDAQRVALQAQLDAAIAQGNTAAINDIKKQQGALELQARTAEVQARLAQQGTMAELSKSNLSVEAQRALADAAATNAAAADYAKSVNTAAEAAAGRQTTTNLANVQTAQQQAEANLQRAAAIEQQNVAATQANRTQNVANKLTADTANVQTGLESEKLRQSGTTSALNTGNVSASTGVSAGQVVTDATKSQASSDAAKQAADRAMMGTIATAAAAASDARVKDDVSPVGTGTATYDELEQRTRRMYPQQVADTRRAFDTIDRGDVAPTPNSRDWAQFFGENASRDFDAMNTAYMLKKAAMREASGEQLSDERTKREVDRMDSQEIQDWAEQATELPVTFRYKPGTGDGGKDVHLGVLAQDLEGTGALGKINVHKDEKGVRSVEYGPTAFMFAKAGFDRATEALELARSLKAAAEGEPMESEDTSEIGPALALAASREERRKAVR